MAKTTWGRKETIIWPRHMPIYTYGAGSSASSLLTFRCGRAFASIWPTPLQRYYLPVYERTSAFGAFMQTHRSSYRMLFVSGPRGTPRPAMNDDVVLGKTAGAGRQTDPAGALSETRASMAIRCSFAAQQRSYVDARFSDYLQGCRLWRNDAVRLLPAAAPRRRWPSFWSCCRSPSSRMCSGRSS